MTEGPALAALAAVRRPRFLNHIRTGAGRRPEPDVSRPIHPTGIQEWSMRVPGDYLDGDRDNPLTAEVTNRSEQQKAGDFRGPYGFGRPAHRPDPDAKYGFAPDPNRALPPRECVPTPNNASLTEGSLLKAE
jgi:hypothetical protein